jgi:hypothetical protein
VTSAPTGAKKPSRYGFREWVACVDVTAKLL